MSNIPKGWIIGKYGTEVAVTSPTQGPGGCYVRGDVGPLTQRILHALASALLVEEVKSSGKSVQLPWPDTTTTAQWAGDTTKFHSPDQIVEYANARVKANQDAIIAELEGMTVNSATARSAIKACIEVVKEMK